MRSPVRLARDLGLRSFLVAQFVLFGMVFSALVHPLMITAIPYLAYVVLSDNPLSLFDRALIGADALSIAGGYSAFLLLGLSRIKSGEYGSFWKVAAATPAYWLLISFAAWKSVKDLCFKPFHWDKTNHKPFTN